MMMTAVLPRPAAATMMGARATMGMAWLAMT